jgi:hypothetical protein
MGSGLRTEILRALAWMVFPMVPAMLEEFYYQISVNLFGNLRSGPDPVDWGWGTWVVMLGPLVGYGFLAGATADVPDDEAELHTRWQRIAGRRAVWVASGAWWGFLVIVAAFLALWGIQVLFSRMPPIDVPDSWKESRSAAVLGWIWTVGLFGVFAYGWLWPARAALRRAGRVGLWSRAFYRGVVTALAFVGSLFGGFWAITSAWRGYFFDTRVVPMIAMAMGLAVVSGCAAPITYGEMRRRELFHAMLSAWVVGLALIWWWSSRRRRGGKRANDRPGPGSSEGPAPPDR